MKRILILSLVIIIGVVSCAPKKEEVALQEGTPAYELAVELGKIIPGLSPETNKVLVSTDTFNLTAGEVIQFMMTNLGNRIDQLKTLDANTLRQYVEQNTQVLTDRKLILAEADKSSLTIPEEDIETALKQNADRAGGMEKYTEFLQANGTTVEEVRKGIETELLIQYFLDSVVATDITVTDEEISALYNSDRSATVQHILFLTQDKTDSEKEAIRKKAEDILSRAQSGEDFAALAKEYSEDPGSKDKGGLYEDFGRGVMVKPFEDAAFNLPLGSISDIVETQYGYHIIKVLDRKRETRPLDEIKKELEDQIKQQKTGQAFMGYMQGLRQKANMQINTL